MQDVLGLPSSARMNRPQTAQGNWRWRLTADKLDGELSRKLAGLTELFGRQR
jgi:4-alpha-glucanotransferase